MLISGREGRANQKKESIIATLIIKVLVPVGSLIFTGRLARRGFKRKY